MPSLALRDPIFLICLVASVGALVAPLRAQEGADITIESVHGKGPATPEDTVAVTNVLGDVRVRTSPLQQVEFTATVQSLSPHQGQPEVRQQRSESGIDIQVDPPDGGEFKGRVDLGVVVLREQATEIETIDGLIEAKGLARRVAAKSRTGNIFLKTSGQFEAETGTGEIFAWIAPATGDAPSTLKTETGNVTVRFSMPADIQLEIATGGSILLANEVGDARADTLQTGGSMIIPFGDASSVVRIESQSGNIQVVVDQPASASAVQPKTVRKDLRLLPQAPGWRPGDPITEVPKDSRSQN